MEVFDFEHLDISAASNETIAALAEALFPLTSERSEEEREIDRAYADRKSGAFVRPTG